MANGSVYRRGNSWYVNFMTAENRRVREKVGSNRRMAEKVLSLRHAQVLQGKYFPANRTLGRLPFSELVQLYIERALPFLKAQRQELNRLKLWVQFFGARPIGLITRAEIETWRREKMATCKPASINRLMAGCSPGIHAGQALS
jgi:hypothetical protein